jgi:hypothetical protein
MGSCHHGNDHGELPGQLRSFKLLKDLIPWSWLCQHAYMGLPQASNEL